MGRFVVVFAAPGGVVGHLVKGRLEAEGISVLAKGETEGPYRMGPMYLLVDEDYEVQARLVLAEIGDQAEEHEA